MIDRVLATIAAVCTAPVVVVLAWLIRREDGGPPLIRVPRSGRGGSAFGMWKLRSMKAQTDMGLANGSTLTNGVTDDRITAVGRRIRSYHLDELPQLWNVVTGDMSLLGPRPETPEFVDLNDPRWQSVLSFPPGIAGPTQLIVSDWEREVISASRDSSGYRSAVLPTKLAIDQWYLSAASPATDLLIAGTLARRFLPGTEAWTLRHRVFTEVATAMPAKAFLRARQVAHQRSRQDEAFLREGSVDANRSRRTASWITARVASALDARVTRSSHADLDPLRMVPVPHAWVWSARVAGGVVLYDAANELAHHLSPEAAIVWRRCDGRSTVPEIATALARSSSVEQEQMLRDVMTVVLQLQGVGALVDAGDESERISPPDPVGRRLYAVDAPTAIRSFDLDHLRQHAYAAAESPLVALGYSFRVFSDVALIRNELSHVFGSLEDPHHRAPRELISDYFVVAVGGEQDSVQLYREGTHLRTCAREEATELLLWYVTQHAVALSPDLALHAAAVERDGLTVLLPAPDGAGKTTLARALVESGWGYVGEDAVGLQLHSQLAQPFAHAFAMHAGGSVAGDRARPFGTREAGPARPWFVAPADVRSEWRADPSPIALVVAPAYRPGAELLIEPLVPAQTLVRLLSAAMNLDVIGRAGFDALVDLARRAPGYRLEYGDVEQVLPVIERMMSHEAEADSTG